MPATSGSAESRGFSGSRLPSARFQIPTSSHRRTAAERGNGLGKVERKSTAVNVAVHGGEPRNHAANESIGTPVTSVSLGSNPTVTAITKAPTPAKSRGCRGLRRRCFRCRSAAIADVEGAGAAGIGRGPHGVHAFSEASAGLPGIHQGGAEHEHDHQRHGDADACDDDARERESVAVVTRGLSAGIDMR